MAQSAATKLINRAARERLKPLGLTQKGQSRVWLDDHGWWVLGVDFESLAYAQGSRLVVFADFMWSGRDYIAHAVGGRVRSKGGLLGRGRQELRCTYDDEESFESCVAELVERAVTEVTAMRSGFPSLQVWADHLDRTAGEDFWRQFDAAMAAALTGDQDRARRWFARMVQSDDGRDWAVAARRDAQALSALASDTGAFTESVKGRARTMRAHLGLPPDFDSQP